jgi:hypothetical protein
MAASGLDLPCTGSSRTHLWLSAPALSTCLSLSPLREGGRLSGEGREGGYGISPSREYASGLRPQELLPRLHQRLSLLSLSLSSVFSSRVCFSRVGSILRREKRDTMEYVNATENKMGKSRFYTLYLRDQKIGGGVGETKLVLFVGF